MASDLFNSVTVLFKFYFILFNPKREDYHRFVFKSVSLSEQLRQFKKEKERHDETCFKTVEMVQKGMLAIPPEP